MTAATKDRAKAGTVEWQVEVQRHHGDTKEPTTLYSVTCRIKANAVRSVTRKLREFSRYDVMGYVTEVKWEAREFPDDNYGTVLDAEAVELRKAYCSPLVDGSIEIEWVDA